MVISALVAFGATGIAYAAGNTVAITGSVTINHYCAFTTNTAAIVFGGSTGLNPGSNTGTMANTISVTDTGNLNSNILTSGTTWTFGSNTFGVSNTEYSASAATSYGSGTALSASSTDTNIPVNTVSANTISYGLGVPNGQAPGTYTQTIDVISSC